MEAADLARWTRFAAKGGIGKCTAHVDCVAESPDDLMFLKGDEITVLMQLADSQGLFLGHCEGVVGRFHGKDVKFHSKLKIPVMAKRSSVSSTSHNQSRSHSSQHDSPVSSTVHGSCTRVSTDEKASGIVLPIVSSPLSLHVPLPDHELPGGLTNGETSSTGPADSKLDEDDGDDDVIRIIGVPASPPPLKTVLPNQSSHSGPPTPSSQRAVSPSLSSSASHPSSPPCPGTLHRQVKADDDRTHLQSNLHSPSSPTLSPPSLPPLFTNGTSLRLSTGSKHASAASIYSQASSSSQDPRLSANLPEAPVPAPPSPAGPDTTISPRSSHLSVASSSDGEVGIGLSLLQNLADNDSDEEWGDSDSQVALEPSRANAVGRTSVESAPRNRESVQSDQSRYSRSESDAGQPGYQETETETGHATQPVHDPNEELQADITQTQEQFSKSLSLASSLSSSPTHEDMTFPPVAPLSPTRKPSETFVFPAPPTHTHRGSIAGSSHRSVSSSFAQAVPFARERRPSATSVVTSQSGNGDEWDGAGDIYDDYRYSRFSMGGASFKASVSSGQRTSSVVSGRMSMSSKASFRAAVGAVSRPRLGSTAAESSKAGVEFSNPFPGSPLSSSSLSSSPPPLPLISNRERGGSVVSRTSDVEPLSPTSVPSVRSPLHESTTMDIARDDEDGDEDGKLRRRRTMREEGGGISERKHSLAASDSGESVYTQASVAKGEGEVDRSSLSGPASPPVSAGFPTATTSIAPTTPPRVSSDAVSLLSPLSLGPSSPPFTRNVTRSPTIPTSPVLSIPDTSLTAGVREGIFEQRGAGDPGCIHTAGSGRSESEGKGRSSEDGSDEGDVEQSEEADIAPVLPPPTGLRIVKNSRTEGDGPEKEREEVLEKVTSVTADATPSLLPPVNGRAEPAIIPPSSQLQLVTDAPPPVTTSSGADLVVSPASHPTTPSHLRPSLHELRGGQPSGERLSLFLPHPNAPKPLNSNSTGPMYITQQQPLPPQPQQVHGTAAQAIHLALSRIGMELRRGPGPTIYGRTATDLSSAMGPVLMMFSVDPPPPPAGTPAPPLVVVTPGHSVPHSRSSLGPQRVGSQVVPPERPISVDQGAGGSRVIPRANFFPKAGGARPRSRSFSGFQSPIGEGSQRSNEEGKAAQDASSVDEARKPRSTSLHPLRSNATPSPGPPILPPVRVGSPLTRLTAPRPSPQPSSPLAQSVFDAEKVPGPPSPNSRGGFFRHLTSKAKLTDTAPRGPLTILRAGTVSVSDLRTSISSSTSAPTLSSSNQDPSPISPLQHTAHPPPVLTVAEPATKPVSPISPTTSRQHTLHTKRSLPNLQRHDPSGTRSGQRSSGNATVQIEDTGFELVRPTIPEIQSIRSSEDSNILGRDRSVDPRLETSLLRADSPSSPAPRSPGAPSDTNSVASATASSPFRMPESPRPSDSEPSMDAHRQREQKWMTLMNTIPASQCRKSKKVKKLLIDGVPSSVRYLVWSHLTDGKARMVPGVYAQLGSRARTNCQVDLEHDIRRLFGDHPQLQTAQNAILSLLQAYLKMVPDTQYTSGLTLIAGHLLVLAPEEDAFWIFVSVMDTHLRAYFGTTNSQMEVDSLLFSRAIEAADPAVGKKLFVSLGISPVTICRSWFTTLFVHCLPLNHVNRLWDIFLYEGVPFLLRIGIALVTCARQLIMESTSEDAVIKLLTHPPADVLPSNPDSFISLAFSAKLKDDDVRKQRIKLEAQVKRQTQGPRPSGTISLPRI